MSNYLVSQIILLYICVPLNGTKNAGQKMQVNKDSDTKRNDLATITAAITGYSDRYVRMVIKGDRNNEIVFDTYMNVREARDSMINYTTRCFHELKAELDESN